MRFINSLFVPLYFLQISNAIFSLPPFVRRRWACVGSRLTAAGVDNRNSTTNVEGDYRCENVATLMYVRHKAGGRGERCSILWFSYAILGTEEKDRKWKERHFFFLTVLAPFLFGPTVFALLSLFTQLFSLACLLCDLHLHINQTFSYTFSFLSFCPAACAFLGLNVCAFVQCVFLALDNQQRPLLLRLLINMRIHRARFGSVLPLDPHLSPSEYLNA